MLSNSRNLRSCRTSPPGQVDKERYRRGQSGDQARRN